MSYTGSVVQPEQEQKRLLRTVPALKRRQTLNTYDIEELANRACNSNVDGFIQQDRQDYDASVLQFSILFQTLFPEYDGERLFKAAQSYVTALFIQSKMKDEQADPIERLHSEKWEYCRNELMKAANLLDLSSSFATETVEAWRYHAARDDGYFKHVMEFNRALVARLTGDEKYFKALAALYFAAITFHDEHNSYSVNMGREVMRLYYRTLFQIINGETKD